MRETLMGEMGATRRSPSHRHSVPRRAANHVNAVNRAPPEALAVGGERPRRLIMNLRVLGLGAVMSLSMLALTACGETMEQRAASGALIGAGAGAVATGEVGGAVVGGVAGAAVGAATTPDRRCVRRD